MMSRFLLAALLCVQAQGTDEGDVVALLQAKVDVEAEVMDQAAHQAEVAVRTHKVASYNSDDTVARETRLDYQAAKYIDSKIGERNIGEVDSVAYTYKDPKSMQRDPALGPLPIMPSDRYLRSTNYRHLNEIKLKNQRRHWNYTEGRILVFPWKVGFLGKHFGIGDGLGNVIHLNLLGDVLYTPIPEVGDPQMPEKDRWYIMPDNAYDHSVNGTDLEIVNRGLSLVGKHLGIKVADYNCEDFATGLRFGQDGHHSGQRDWWVQFVGDTEKKILGTTQLTHWAKNSKWLFKTLDDMVGWTNDAGISMKAADIFEQVL